MGRKFSGMEKLLPPSLDFRLSFIETSESEIAVYEVGERKERSVLLVNGLGGGFSSWYPLVKSSGFYSVGWDYRGLGRSTSFSADFSLKAHAQDMKAVVDRFFDGKFSIVAWSMGVAVAIEYIRMYKDERIDKIVFVSGIDCNIRDAFSQKLGKAFVKFLESPLFCGWLKVQEGMRGIFQRTSVAHFLVKFANLLGMIDVSGDNFELAKFLFIRWFYENRPESFCRIFHEYLTWCGKNFEISVPVLFIWGRRDYFIPERHFLEFARRLAFRTELEQEVFENGTHYIPIEFPELFSFKVKRFLGDEGKFSRRGKGI